MAQGPNEARLLTSLEGAEPGEVAAGADEWERCAYLLRGVARSIMTAAARDEQIGGETGPAMGVAFTKTAESITERAQELLKGEGALRKAATAIRQAKKGKEKLDLEHPAIDHPGTYQRPVGPLEPKELEEQAAHQAAITKYNDTYAAREKTTEYWARHMDDTFDASAAVMKSIHGEPDPVPPKDDGGPGGDRRGIPTTPGTPQGPRDDPDDPRDDIPRDDDDPGDDDPRDDIPRDDDHGDDDSGDDRGDDGEDSDDTPEIYTDHGTDGGGLSTGTLGGLAVGAGGGALALRGLRGGPVLPSALSSTGARPIGSTGRYGASGALGRGAIAPGSPVARGGAASGRGGAGAGGIGTRGGRGAAGGKGTGRGARAGTGGIGTGRGRGKKDEEEKQSPRDLFDDGDDWIDDEGAAPDVID